MIATHGQPECCDAERCTYFATSEVIAVDAYTELNARIEIDPFVVVIGEPHGGHDTDIVKIAMLAGGKVLIAFVVQIIRVVIEHRCSKIHLSTHAEPRVEAVHVLSVDMSGVTVVLARVHGHTEFVGLVFPAHGLEHRIAITDSNFMFEGATGFFGLCLGKQRHHTAC